MPSEWIERFTARLHRLRPDTNPDEVMDLAAKLWAAGHQSPEQVADMVASLLPDDEE